MPGLEATALSGSLGAEIRGVDLARAGRAEADAILALIAEHLVLFFPDQHLTPDQHIAFGRLFGKLEGHPNLAMDAERPEFFELRAESGAGAVAADDERHVRHSDPVRGQHRPVHHAGWFLVQAVLVHVMHYTDHLVPCGQSARPDTLTERGRGFCRNLAREILGDHGDAAR